MTILRRLAIAAALLLGLSPAFAQAPPPVPALPDSPRLTQYVVSSGTCACALNFQLYGNPGVGDYYNWVEVFINGVRYNYNDPLYGWTITSPTGPLSSIPVPITDAVLTFNTAQTGTVTIVGADRPARLTQFQENAGVSARNLNVAITSIVADLREIWDKINDVSGRGLFFTPGNVTGPMPAPATCANAVLGFDITGLNPICLTGGSGGIGGTTPTVVNDLAVWNNTIGTLVTDGGVQISDVGRLSTNQTYTGNKTFSGTFTLAGVTGATQCLQANASGVVGGTGVACGSGGGGASTPVNQQFLAAAGTTTITLTNTPVPTAAGQVTIYFDGIEQDPATWSLNTVTNIITFAATIPANVQSVQASWFAPTLVSGVTNIAGNTGAISCGPGIDCTSIANTISAQEPVASNVYLYGARGASATVDTAAFNSALAAAVASGGSHRIYFPPLAGGACYLINAVNLTNLNHLILEGNGDASCITISGQDGNGNWMDLSGSNDILFRNLYIKDNGSTVRIGLLWACTGTNCNGSGVVTGLSFDHVNINAKFVLAGLYAYGYGCVAPGSCGNSNNLSGGSLSCTNSTWTNTNNGPVAGYETRTAVVDLTAYNAGSVRSSYQTLTTSTAIAAMAYFANCAIVDYGNGTSLSNNAAMIVDGVNQFTFVQGAIECLCEADFISWTSSEGITIIQTPFQASTGTSLGSCVVNYWLLFGGGVNAAVTLETPLFSCAATANIALDQGVSASGGGIWFLHCHCEDVGLNSLGVPFIGKTGNGCGAFSTANAWIQTSDIAMVSGVNNIVGCGGIDTHTIIRNPGTISLGGGVDSSHHF